MSYVDTFINDMALFHDAPADNLQPSGIPSWGSAAYYPEAYAKPGSWIYGIPWFHCMEDCPLNLLNARDAGLPWRYPGPYTGNQAPNTRVEVAHIQGWLLRPNNQWELWNYAQRAGGYMTPINWDEYSGGPFENPTLRNETIGSSILAPGRGIAEDHNWHSFTGAREMGSYLGIATCLYARLILDDNGGTDDRASCKVLMGVAGDYYQDYATVIGDKFGGVNVLPMGYSRLKYVTNEWQLFAFYSTNTLSEAQFRANPPPIQYTELLSGTTGGGTTDPNPPPVDPGPPYSLPAVGNWFAIESAGVGNWDSLGVAGTTTTDVRRRRRGFLK
jgi:hypothetical protein